MQPLPGARHPESTDDVRASGGQVNAERVIRLLNDALATEILCILRYKRHYYMSAGLQARLAKAQFFQYVGEKQAHADHLAERIVQLGGTLELPHAQLLNRSHAEYIEGDSLSKMLRADLLAEQIAIEHYRAMITSIGPNDPTTRQVLERILVQEEAHAESLAHLARDCTPE